MKLLVSDYSNTFKIANGSLYLNKCAVEEFMKSGNKFVLSTNHSFESINKEIKHYNINYNYLICNNGHITYDKNNNIINCNYLDEESLSEILYSLKNSAKYIEKYKIENNVMEILAVFNNEKNAKKYTKKLLLENKFLPIRLNKFVYITNKYDKVDAINCLGKMLKIDERDIYTICSDKKDLSMLKSFNGYMIENFESELLFENIKTISGVHELIKKLNR